MTSTDSLPPERRYGNVVVVTPEQIGPLLSGTTSRYVTSQLGQLSLAFLRAR